MNKNKKLFNYNFLLIFFCVIVVTLILSFVTNRFVLNQDFYNRQFQETLDQTTLQKMVKFFINIQSVGYLLTPIIFFLKLVVIAGLIFSGIIYLDIREIKFNFVLRVVLVAQIVMLIGDVTRFAYFIVFGIKNLQQLQDFYPLSLQNFIKANDAPFYVVYILRTLNIFELAYILLLVLGIKVQTNTSFAGSAKLIVCTYGLGMLVWILLIIFLQLQLT